MRRRFAARYVALLAQQILRRMSTLHFLRSKSFLGFAAQDEHFLRSKSFILHPKKDEG
jgi:hypothetical protein